MEKGKVFTRTIWVLCFVSLFNDISSEMLYPVLPVYLSSIGFSALWIGILEGIAEFVVGLSKGYFGQLSDSIGKRLPFVQAGYFLSGFFKSALILSRNPGWILFSRSGDKLGKGIRTAARDALLSGECKPEDKGKVFGLHRAMDTVGAAIGPAIALVYLYYHPSDYTSLFYIAFIPAFAGLLLTVFIKENSQPSGKSKPGFFSYFSYWKEGGSIYRRLITGLLIFALLNSSDIFLLLMARTAGFSELEIIGAYVFYNLVYAVFAYPLGSLSDRIGMKPVLVSGYILFAAVYAAIAFVSTPLMLYLVFFAYGIYSAATDGVAKAWIAKISPPREAGTAMGLYASALSIASMLGSFLAGLLWTAFNPATTFLTTCAGALIAVFWLLLKVRK